jgi:nucleotide-binding universal stress UspA family protein
MVNHEAQRRYENIVAPIDMSGASANALRAALSTGLIAERATLLHAFSGLAPGKISDQAGVDGYVASERRQVMDELAAFLVANDLQRAGWSIRVEQGGPMEIISRVVSAMRPDLLVMGTHGRSALVKTLIGSVTEEALRSLNVDILAVPSVKR